MLLLVSVKEGERGADGKIAMTVEHRLLQDLIYSESYSREVRPALHDNEVLRVAFSLSLVQIVDVVSYEDFASLLYNERISKGREVLPNIYPS